MKRDHLRSKRCGQDLGNVTRPRPQGNFGKSDHAAIFLTPDYKQRILQEPPVEREVTLPTPKLRYRRLLMTSTGTCYGRVHLTSANSRR